MIDILYEKNHHNDSKVVSYIRKPVAYLDEDAGKNIESHEGALIWNHRYLEKLK